MAGLVNFGKREDGTEKGTGWFGILPMQDGSNAIATELSASFNYGNGNVLVPLLNPKLSEREVQHLLKGREPTKEIWDKARAFGFERIQQLRSPFIGPVEQPSGLVNMNRLAWNYLDL